MFRSLLAGKSRHRAAIVAGALAGVVTPLAAHASLTISLQLATGAAGATQSVKYLTRDNNNTDVPVYVYATVDSGTAVGAGNFDAVQYAYYNVNMANVGTAINNVLDGPGSTMAIDPAATTAYNFDGLGQQQLPTKDVYTNNGDGIGANTNSGILAGSTTVLNDLAHPRSNTNGPIFNNASANAGYVYTSGTKVSFLVETLQVKPGVFTASTLAASGQNYTKFSASTPDLTTAGLGGPGFQSANWNENSSTSTGTGSASSIKNTSTGTYGAAAGFVTFEDTLLGDANANGTVDINDVIATIGHFNQPATWATGDFTGIAGTDDINDVIAVIGNFNSTLVGITPLALQQLTMIADESQNPLLLNAVATASVPEPASLGLITLAATSLLARRKRSML